MKAQPDLVFCAFCNRPEVEIPETVSIAEQSRADVPLGRRGDCNCEGTIEWDRERHKYGRIGAPDGTPKYSGLNSQIRLKT
jgi:hypothetical protein